MNAPDLNRVLLKHHIATIEAKHPLRILGMLPRGAAGHVAEERAVDLLGEKAAGLSYLGLAQAEADLGDLIGRPVGIVLVSELTGHEADELVHAARPV